MSSVALRAFAPVSYLEDQVAAYWGLTGMGALPLAGMSELVVEVAPGNGIYRLADAAMKAASVRSTGQLVDRDFGFLELHAEAPETVAAAGRAILAELGLGLEDRERPEIVSTQIVDSLTAAHSQLVNRVRRGNWTLPGDSLFVLELTPAAYVYAVANEVVKTVPVELVRMAGTGVYGRLIVAGTEAAIREAEAAAQVAVDRLRNDSDPKGG